MKPARNAAIEQARLAGASYVDLAKEHGISAARVRQVVVTLQRKRLFAECREGLHGSLTLVETGWYDDEGGRLTVEQVRNASDADLKWRFGSNNVAVLRRRFGRA